MNKPLANPSMAILINILLYQAGWFACVLGAAWDRQWLGISIALTLLAVHFYLATDRQLQFRLVLVAAAVGITVDTAQLWAGVFLFPHGVMVEFLPPPFMTVLWMQFATTFRCSMRWLSKRYAICALFGLVGAPLAFFAGQRLGAIEFLSPRFLHFFVLGIIWSFCVPFLVFISDSLEKAEQSRLDDNLSGSEISA